MNSDLGLSSYIDILNSALQYFSRWGVEFWTKIAMFYLTDRIQYFFYLLCFWFLLFFFSLLPLCSNVVVELLRARENQRSSKVGWSFQSCLSGEGHSPKRWRTRVCGQLGIWRPFHFRLWDQKAWKDQSLLMALLPSIVYLLCPK